MLDVALVIPELLKYGGAERLLMECAARWQRKHHVTIYSTDFNETMLREHHVGDRVSLVRLSPYFEGEHAPLLNCVLLPKVWEHEIGTHDVYNTHLWPTHLIDLHPTVWYPHEPLRVLHDLRGDETVIVSGPTLKRNIHVYPRQQYDSVSYTYFEACLSAMDQYEKMGRPDRVVANSAFAASYLEDVYGRKVTDVVYPGVNIPPSLCADLQADQTCLASASSVSVMRQDIPTDSLIVTIGQLWPHKRIDLVIQACSLVEEIHLCVVGQGPERKTLEALAQALGIGHRVSFLEGLSNAQLHELMQAALAVVFVPRNEPFGIVALESMALGKPLIAADEGGYTEVVHESCAILVPPRIDLIADNIRRLREQPELARQMGLAGRERARAYTWDRTASELMAILEDTHRSFTTRQRKVSSIHGPDESAKPLFGVQYYCWYGGHSGSAHWNDGLLYGTVTDIPLSGYYMSCKESTLKDHFDQLEGAGIHFAILNLHVDSTGINPYEKECIEKAFRTVSSARRRLRLAVQVCPYNCSLSQLHEAIDLVGQYAMNSRHYLKMNDRSVLYLFWTGYMDGDKTAVDRLRNMVEGFTLIASTTRFYDPRSEPKKTFGLFDGFSLFSPLEIAEPSQWETAWKKAYRNGQAGNDNLNLFTICPGYDDAHLKDPSRSRNASRTIDREGGRVFQMMIDCALSLDPVPDQIIVSTFNEFHENTHIEPSVAHGSLYLDMTRDMVRESAKRWGPRKAS